MRKYDNDINEHWQEGDQPISMVGFHHVHVMSLLLQPPLFHLMMIQLLWWLYFVRKTWWGLWAISKWLGGSLSPECASRQETLTPESAIQPQLPNESCRDDHLNLVFSTAKATKTTIPTCHSKSFRNKQTQPSRPAGRSATHPWCALGRRCHQGGSDARYSSQPLRIRYDNVRHWEFHIFCLL